VANQNEARYAWDKTMPNYDEAQPTWDKAQVNTTVELMPRTFQFANGFNVPGNR